MVRSSDHGLFHGVGPDDPLDREDGADNGIADMPGAGGTGPHRLLIRRKSAASAGSIGAGKLQNRMLGSRPKSPPGRPMEQERRTDVSSTEDCEHLARKS